MSRYTGNIRGKHREHTGKSHGAHSEHTGKNRAHALNTQGHESAIKPIV